MEDLKNNKQYALGDISQDLGQLPICFINVVIYLLG